MSASPGSDPFLNPPPAPPTPLTPPTTPGPLGVPQRPSAWPTVIGILAIILGAIGLLGSVWGTVAPFVGDKLLVPTGTPADTVARTIMEKWKWPTLVTNVLGVVAAVMLLTWGIWMHGRRRSCVRLANAWAIFVLLTTVASAVVGYFATEESFAAIMSSTSMPAGAPTAAVMKAGALIGALCGGLFQAAPPIFILIWLARGKIRAEVATWRP